MSNINIIGAAGKYQAKKYPLNSRISIERYAPA
jgi:hypothetical protein